MDYKETKIGVKPIALRQTLDEDLIMHENLLHYWIFLTSSDSFSTRAKTGEYW